MNYQSNGNLIPGIHLIDWTDFVSEFGYNGHRMNLVNGLSTAIYHLKSCGCSTIYVDGSFVSRKFLPNDYDVCWDHSGVDLSMVQTLYPVFFDFTNFRANQKRTYGGEFFPATTIANPVTREIYLDFFQHDKNGDPKGIIRLTL